MQQAIVEFSKALAGMSGPTLIVVVILGAFGLAAYAISAVVKVSKNGRR